MIVVTAAQADTLRKLSALLDGETAGMFTAGLSATGFPPATHFISAGQMPGGYLASLASPAALKSAADAATARTKGPSFTAAQVTAALGKCTIGSGRVDVIDAQTGLAVSVPEGPHEMIARLGLKLLRS
jgi:hypothetical protein